MKPALFQQAGRDLLHGQGTVPVELRWAAGRAKPLGYKEASSIARVAIAAQRAVKAVAATVMQEKAKLAPGVAVDLTVCLDSRCSGHLPSADLARAHGLT